MSDGGMSTTGAAEAPPDEFPAELGAGPERLEAPDPEVDETAEATDEQAAADWRDSLDDESRRYAESKGWKSPADMLRSQREAEAEMHRTRQLAEEYERAFATMGQGDQQPQQGAQEPDLGQAINQAAASIKARYDAGKIDEGELFMEMAQLNAEALAVQAAQLEQRFGSRLSESLEDRLAPLQENQWRDHWSRERAAIQTSLGEDYGRLAPRAREHLQEMIREQPSMRENKQAMRIAFDRAIAEEELSKRRERSAQTIQGGGRSRRTEVDPAEEIIKGMDAVSPRGMSGGML